MAEETTTVEELREFELFKQERAAQKIVANKAKKFLDEMEGLPRDLMKVRCLEYEALLRIEAALTAERQDKKALRTKASEIHYAIGGGSQHDL